MMTMLAIILTIILVVLKVMAVISISWLLALLPILITIGGWIIFYTVYFYSLYDIKGWECPRAIRFS